MVSLYSYCTADKPGLQAFAFRLYDTGTLLCRAKRRSATLIGYRASDNSGLLDLGEIQQLIREVYGDDFKTSKRAKAVCC